MSSAPQARRVLSGMRPTGQLHLGNYHGALRNWVDLQYQYECYFFVADWHALTTGYEDTSALQGNIHDMVVDWLAAGLNPGVATLFVQSQVPAHTQLTWVLECLTGFGEAGRMTQFKDKSQKGGADRSSVGLFTYPILQAADILAYQADAVPVGEDQRQHLELTRNLAQRFNSRFGPTLTVPEPYILKTTAKIYDLSEPSAKMSKSSPGGALDLLAPVATSMKKIKSAVTDTGREVRYDEAEKPGVSNLLSLLSVFTGTSVPDLEVQYQGRGYGDLKKDLAEAFAAFVTPLQQQVAVYLDDPGELDRVLAAGAARARQVADGTVAAVFDKVGLLQG